MLAVLCTRKCVFYLCEGEVYVGYTVHHKVCFTCVEERCAGYTVYPKVCFTCVKERLFWPYCGPQSVVYLCEAEVCVGCTVYHKVCFTCVRERCVLAILCTTRCVLPLWRRGVCWPYCVPQGVFYLCEGEVCVGFTVWRLPRKACFTTHHSASTTWPRTATVSTGSTSRTPSWTSGGTTSTTPVHLTASLTDRMADLLVHLVSDRLDTLLAYWKAGLLTDWRTYLMAHCCWMSSSLADWPTDWAAGWLLTDWQISRLIGWFIEWLTRSLTDWHTHWVLTDWLTDWLTY